MLLMKVSIVLLLFTKQHKRVRVRSYTLKLVLFSKIRLRCLHQLILIIYGT